MNVSILLFGATSILGFNLAKRFPLTILPFVPAGNKSPSVRHWSSLQLEDISWLKAQFKGSQCKTLIYCHAICDVAKCEADPDWAHKINVAQLERVIKVLPEKTRLIYVSSDHVFGGDGRYTEASLPSPISVYGRTRIAAENLVLTRARSLVLRMGLAIGPSPNGRSGHLDWMSYRSGRGLPITIIEDEYRSVVCVDDLLMRIMQYVESDLSGIRHITATRLISRVDLAKHLLSSLGKNSTFKVESRHQQSTPHIGRIALESLYGDALSKPLPCVVEMDLKEGK